MTTFFTSDTHFGHSNIIKYCRRPFTSAEHMDRELILNWNSVVKDGDEVFHLGDFSLGNKPASYYLQQLHGKVYFIEGNHDKNAYKERRFFVNYFTGFYELEIENQKIVLCHYPMRVWNHSHRGSWHLFGHLHGNLPDDPTLLSFDVGVDCHRYFPISYADVKVIMSRKTPEKK